MGNILSYLKWRGDLDFMERGFCDADNLVLSCLVYLDFKDIIAGEQGSSTVREASEIYFRLKAEGKRQDRAEDQILYEMARSKRYGDAVLSGYVEKRETEEEIQFAAMQIALDDGTYYLAFRGTDESIVGWREDFSISYKVVPAQQRAVEYLEKMMTREGKIYRVGGHSKGGNLAVYAAMRCQKERQGQILQVYNNDGPGICREIFDEEGYRRIEEKITRIIPSFSVIGMLFAPEEESVIVESSGRGLMQHDLLTWKVEGDKLCTLPELEKKSRFYNQIFDTWIESADMEQRESFTRDFFNALEANGAKTIPEITEGGLDGFGTILISIAESESRTKIIIGKLIKSFWENIKKIDIKKSMKSKEGVRGSLIIFAGLVFLLAPELAIQSIGTILSLTGLIWSAKKIMECGMQENDVRRKQKRLMTYIGLFALSVFLVTHHSVLLISGSLLLGLLFLFFSLYLLKRMAQMEIGKFRKYGLAVISILMFFIGCVSLVTPNDASWQKMVSMGSVLILYGFGTVLLKIYHSGEGAVQSSN